VLNFSISEGGESVVDLFDAAKEGGADVVLWLVSGRDSVT